MPNAVETLRLSSIDALAAIAQRGAHGASWYSEARPLLEERARVIGSTLQEYTSVLAITSPRVRVARNVALTEAYLRHGDPDQLPCLPGVRAGLRHYARTGEVRGPKTAPFARALQGDPLAVVVDVWVARAFVPVRGRAPSSTVETYQRALTTVQGHRIASSRIAAAGRRVGLEPRDAQAAIWHGIYRGTAPSLLDILSSLS